MDVLRKTVPLVALAAALLIPAAATASSPPGPPNCAGVSGPTTFNSTAPVAIADGGIATSTITVPGPADSILDVDVLTSIDFPDNDDLDIALTSPNGQVTTLSTDNGPTVAGDAGGGFDGATFDDDANAGGQVPYSTNGTMVTDRLWFDGLSAATITPEEPLGALIGGPSAGVWTLTVVDDEVDGAGGTIDDWSVRINTIPGSTFFSSEFAQAENATDQAISGTGPSVITSTVTVSGAAPWAHNLAVFVGVQHADSGDLDITLTSPAGTVVTLTTDNGNGRADAFAGTLFNDLSDLEGSLPYVNNPNLVTDRNYTVGAAPENLTPEEPLAAFAGEDPNGTWTLRISDDDGAGPGTGGTLTGWGVFLDSFTCNDLRTTASANTPVVQAGEPVTYTATVFSHANASAPIAGGELVVTLPSGMGFSSIQVPPNWACTPPAVGSSGDITCNRPVVDVLPNTQANFLVTAVPTTAAIGVATVTASADADLDAIESNDTSAVLTTVLGPPVPPANPGPLPGCGTPSVVSPSNPTDVAISETGTPVVSSTIEVAGAPAYLTDVDVFTKLLHTLPTDLDVTLRSPAGTVVTLTSDNGGGADDVFGGTTFDDDANPDGPLPYTVNPGLATDRNYVANVVAPRLAPEEPLAAFIGENPNGTWTLTVSDDSNSSGGTLDEWSLSLTGQPTPPQDAAGSAANDANVAFSTLTPQTSTIDISGAGPYLTDVDVLTRILHNSSADIDLSLRSPQGTEVTLTTDNGIAFNNVFNGTTFDDDADPGGQVPYTSNPNLVTDRLYANDVVAPRLAPEEGLGAFIGENPNGTWTLRLSDDNNQGINGTLDEWSLSFKTGACVTPQGPPGDTPPGGNPPGGNPPGGSPPPRATAASLTRLKLTPSTFRVSGRKPLGTTIAYRLDKAATVTFTVQRETTGRRSGTRCVAETRRNRRAKKCTRLVAVAGSLRQSGKAGTNSLKFAGKLNRKALPVGSYRVRAVAAVGALRSKTIEARFKVAKPRR